MGKLSILSALFIILTLATVQGGVIENRLFGSKDVEKSTQAYHVALFVEGRYFWPKETFVGSGVLLSDRWVITSAQVASQLFPRFWQYGKVKAGLLGLDSTAVDMLEVEQVVLHEFYNKSGVADNDIALLKVKEPYFILNEHVNYISYAQDEPKGQVVVTAWKALYQKHKPRQELSVDIKDRIECGEALGKPEYIDETVFCVENTDKRAVCKDDHGSPAIVVNGDQQYLAGIFSWAQDPEEGKEACSTKPAIFTNIAWYRNWIKNNML